MSENGHMEREQKVGQAIVSLYSVLEAQRASSSWGDKLKAAGYVQHRNNYQGTLVPKVVVHDHTAINSFDMYVNGFIGYLVPQDDRWFQLVPSSVWEEGKKTQKMGGYQTLLSKDGLMQLSEYMTDICLDTFVNGSMYDSVKAMFKDGETLGNGYIYVEEGKDSDVYFREIDPQECVIAENPKREVDVFIRKYCMSAIDLVRKYPEAELGSVRSMVFNTMSSEDANIDIYEAILPSDYLWDYETRSRMTVGDGRKVAHVVYLPSEMKVIHEGGFNEMPVFSFAPSRDTDRVPYGNGIVSKYLTSIITLDEMANMKMIMFQKNANPPMLVHNALRGSYSSKAGAINYTGDVQTQTATPLFKEGASNNYQAMVNDIDNKKNEMRTLLCADLFRTIMGSTDSRKTAYEVSELKNEAVTLLAMKIGSFGQKVLEPIVKRTLKCLARNGKLEAPEGIPLNNICSFIDDCHILLNSVFIRRLQNYLRYQGFTQGLNFIAMVAQLEQSKAMQVLDEDALIRGGLFGAGFPVYAIKDKNKLDAERRQMEVQAQQMMQMQQAQQGADAFAKLGKGMQSTGMDMNQMLGGQQ